ncbi:MAG: 50S ribosomal protein L17 [Ignavibacteriae bacterium]|nr:50S ribosomal protein L17 [Ignavibacteriota bacterium]
MRHRKSGRKLKRTASHRRATLNALATALLRHKRIHTTIAKAKETRMVVEKMITRAKNARKADASAANVGASSERAKKFIEAGGHARREVARHIKDRAVVAELFDVIAEKVASRPGGYTRILKLGQRYGDAAEMAVIELVDFNVGQEPAAKKAEKPAKKTTPKKKAPKKTKGDASAKAEAATPAGSSAPAAQ